MKKPLTLCIVHKDDKVLLGLKKRGFGEGRWNGFGGKLEEGETIEEAAKREMFEESGLTVEDINKCGILEFRVLGDTEILEVHIFKALDFEGKPVESDEMKPDWFGVDELPLSDMWPDDEHWFPLFLKGKKFKGKFLFDDKINILEKELFEVDNI